MPKSLGTPATQHLITKSGLISTHNTWTKVLKQVISQALGMVVATITLVHLEIIGLMLVLVEYIGVTQD